MVNGLSRRGPIVDGYPETGIGAETLVRNRPRSVKELAEQCRVRLALCIQQRGIVLLGNDQNMRGRNRPDVVESNDDIIFVE